MTVTLSLVFVMVGTAAVIAMAATLHRYAPRAAALHRALQDSSVIDVIRLTVREHAVHHLKRGRRRVRHLQGPKPMRHRRRARRLHRALT